ncbi:hypothetical protein P1S61_21535 [Streptomyces sp. ME08-AFT2]|uniref:hypothetical protein n=1 Tax=Streptomyces sp. ME08-AFT2 TaxID=3028683 RepID=UPI0029BF4B63|nr:hypothetical protein [Streptomyces sp. ME08-AFT2]MDX3311597.1 hypothetical protein [Streptomyces sp. ME08-AFT2]
MSNSVFTAAQYNQFVRDNSNETAPAKATTAGSHFAGTGLNSIAERTSAAAIVATSQTTTSTSYTDLATVGPAVTVTTGPLAWVHLYNSNVNTTSVSSLMSFEVSGASSIPAADNQSIGIAGTAGSREGAAFLLTTLTPGSNTFTCKYRVGSGTGTYADRRIAVLPL